MSLLNPSKVERRSDPPGALIPSNAQYGGSLTVAGNYINPDTALRIGTVWSCVNLLSELVGVTLGYNAVREVEGVRVRAVTDPVMLRNPSPRPNINAKGWRRQIVQSWQLRGNAWGLVTARDTYGNATAIDIMHPDWVTYSRRGVAGPFTYRLLGEEMELYPGGNLWHSPGLIGPGSPIGLSPISYGANSMGLRLAAENFGAEWFAGNGVPTGIYKSDQVIDDTTAKSAKARIMETLRNKREPLVLGQGLDYTQISVAPNESQFLDTIKATDTTIAQFFGLQVALDLIGGESGSSMTYANVEQQNLNLLTYAASGWIGRMEDIGSELTPKPYYCAADLSALLRVDAETKSKIEASDLHFGKRSSNEVRHVDGLPPIKGGDRVNFPPKAVAFDHSSASGTGDDEHPLAPAEPPDPASDPVDHSVELAEPSNGDA